MQNDIVRQQPQASQQPDTPTEELQPQLVEQPQLQAVPEQVQNKPAKPVGVILTALILCGALVGTAIYAGMQQAAASKKAAPIHSLSR